MFGSGVDDLSARRPTAAELAGAAVRVAAGHYRSLIGAVAAILAPTAIIGGITLSYWRDQAATNGSTSGGRTLLALLGLVVVAIGNMLVQAAGVHAATSAAVGGVVDWRASVRVALGHRSTVIAASLLVTVLAFIGLVVFVIPGVYLWFTWFVVTPVVVLENRSAFGALARSRELVRGRWWSTFAAFVLVQLLVVALSIPVGFVVGVIFSSASGTAAVVQQLATYAVEILLTPVELALVAVVYLDLRRGHDGLGAREVARAAGIELAGERFDPDPWSASPPPPPRSDRPAAEGGAPSGGAVEPASGGAPQAPPAGGASPGGAMWPAVSPKPPPPVNRVSRQSVPGAGEPPDNEPASGAQDADEPGRD